MVATPRVGLLAFEPLLELRASLNSYIHHSSAEWSDGQLAGAKTQLEGARAAIEYLRTEIEAHQRILSQWKPSAESSHDNKRRHESTEKKNKKRRIHEDYKLENDSSYSSYSSPEEADVDVDGDEGDIDVEALDGEDSHAGDAEEATKEDEYVPKSRINKRGNRMAQMIVRRHQGKPSVRRQKFKNLSSASGGTPSSSNPRRAKSDMPPTASPTEYDAGVAGAAVSSSESEEETTPVPLGSGAFWTAMEPYLRPPTEQDLAYITPKPQRDNDPIFTIPPLGSHYLQVWASDDGANSPPVRHSGRAVGREAGANEADSSIDGDAPDPVMGDITKRILQSLIDEHIIMNRPPSPFPDESPTALDENKENNTSSIPTIPVVNYSRAQMIALEGRIKLELHAIGLLDDEDPVEREDDEVCAELRLNQSLLKDQIAINNAQRMNLITLVKAKMHENEENQKQKAHDVQIEKNHQKLVQRKKKRGGRRAPAHVTT